MALRPSDSPRNRVYRAVVLYFIVVFLAMMWPVYPVFSKISPMLLGIPLSLFYLVVLLLLSFIVLLSLYLWESHRGELD